MYQFEDIDDFEDMYEFEDIDELAYIATHYPDWRPFDSANERFVRTPADSRLPPPVILANKIVFKKPHYKAKRV
jgi:hypothetical protein